MQRLLGKLNHSPTQQVRCSMHPVSFFWCWVLPTQPENCSIMEIAAIGRFGSLLAVQSDSSPTTASEREADASWNDIPKSWNERQLSPRAVVRAGSTWLTYQSGNDQKMTLELSQQYIMPNSIVSITARNSLPALDQPGRRQCCKTRTILISRS